MGAEITVTVIWRSAAQVAVPDLTGMTFDDAQRLRDRSRPRAVHPGRASDIVPRERDRHDPPPGTEVQAGSTVTIFVSTGPER